MSQLFIGPGPMGDAILATGLIDRMLQDRPGEGITIACGPAAAAMLATVPRLEALHVMRKRGVVGHWWELWRAVAGRRWSRVVDMRRSAFAWTVWAGERLIVPRPFPGEHRADTASRTLGVGRLAPRVWLDAASESRAAAMLPAGRPVLALGTGANWICKTWPAERYADLARRLLGRGGAMEGGVALLVGTQAEREAAREVMAAVPAIDAFDVGIPLTAALLARADLFVGNDSGLMHLAAAAGARTVGLFGPTPDAQYGPYGREGLVVRTPESLAELLEALKREGPVRSLMTGLSAEAVEAAVRRRWPDLVPLPADYAKS